MKKIGGFKNISIVIFTFVLIMSFKNTCFGISDKFKFVIDTIGIPRYNVYGEEINESIYYTYNVFSYSSPEAMYGITNNQRFKEVINMGKWYKDGIRGEYNILGRGYSGQAIYNVYFPVDAVPEVTPDRWNYIGVWNAYASWQDSSKYKYVEQLEYMKNTHLLFDTIDYNTNTCNPYNLVEYNISANSIGLDKVSLNTCSTWKTYGIVTVNRINNKGEIRYATLATAPMAASATVKSKFESDNNILIPNDKDSVNVNIKFGAEAINLNNYATKEQIKEIYSILYIDGVEVAKISGSKTVSVDKKISYTVSRNMFSSPGKNTIHVKVVSYLYTEFSVDGLMEDVYEQDLVINVDEKLIVPIKNKNVYLQKKYNNKLVVSPLVQTNITNKVLSSGFAEKGRKLALVLKLSDEVKQLYNIAVYLDDNKLKHDVLLKNDNCYILGIEIPSNTKNTLATWNYYRDKLQNYFEIDFSKIGTRVTKPKVISIKFNVGSNSYEEKILIDIVDDYLKNINYIFQNGVINKEEINKKYSLEDIANE